MKYFLFLVHSQTWSTQAFTIEELMQMPGVNDQSLLAPMGSPDQTLTFAQAKTLHMTQLLHSAPSQHTSLEAETPGDTSRDDSNGEHLYTYRMVCGTCQFILYQMIFWNYLLIGLLLSVMVTFCFFGFNMIVAICAFLIMSILTIFWARRRAAGRVKGIGKASQMDGDPWWWHM